MRYVDTALHFKIKQKVEFASPMVIMIIFYSFVITTIINIFAINDTFMQIK
jgi:hypothetical protein